MNIVKKILIVLVVLLFTCILWNLISQRQQLLKYTAKKENFELLGTSPESELAKVGTATSRDINAIQSISRKNANRPLREYIIKSSFNSAITGNYVNLDMIKYVLSRGCRFLDFEVFMMNDAPVVAYSADRNPDMIDTDNSVLLDAILANAVSNAFSQYSPNNQDPLFIHLRIKSKDPRIYKQVAKSVDFALKMKLYDKRITQKTTLNDIMGKVVLVMDKTLNRDYVKLAHCNIHEKSCYDLNKMINLESGSEEMYIHRYSEILNQCAAIPRILNACDKCTDVKNMRLILPDLNYKNTKNPDFGDFVTKHGCQLVTYRFYSKDKELDKYEAFFNENKAGIVPLAYGIQHLLEPPIL